MYIPVIQKRSLHKVQVHIKKIWRTEDKKLSQPPKISDFDVTDEFMDQAEWDRNASEREQVRDNPIDWDAGRDLLND